MENFIVEIDLISEAIFGNGESSTSFVDIEILKDEIGIPFFKGKTFKGKLREEVYEIEKILIKNNLISDNNVTEALFGKEGEYNPTILKFSDCKIDSKIENNLRYAIEENIVNKDELTEAFTEIRTFTKIDDKGIAEIGSLRQARVIRKGIKLYTNIICQRELTKIEKGLLACGISALRNIGMMESRGKGQVVCRIFAGSEDITEKYMNYLINNDKK